jgi:hypothetical protein
MGTKRKKLGPEPVAPEYPKVLEQFGRPYLPGIGGDDGPSCFNGIVRVERYRVTVEKIEESPLVYCERLLKLWRECDNHHHRAPLAHAAKRLGTDLPPAEFGVVHRSTTKGGE